MSLDSLSAHTRATLEACDAELFAGPSAALSLGEQGRARSPAQLCELLVIPGKDDAWAEALALGLCKVTRAQQAAFPHNIFGDLDYLAASVLRQGRAAQSRALVQELLERMSQLQVLYGEATVIRFRYVHDFTYGYDWAKWVQREPEQTGAVGPFDLEFLEYMDKRGAQLIELIAADDVKYPTLRDARHRNPFPFSREPDAETQLFGELAKRGCLPVETYRVDATPQHDRSFAELRVQCAADLGLLIEGAA